MRQGEFCWVSGTVFKDMPLKPNILDDISKDVRANLAEIAVSGLSWVLTPSLALDICSATSREIHLAFWTRSDDA